MFRVTKDEYFDLWYIHKKFLFWWIKWYHNPFIFAGRKYQINKSNITTEAIKIPIIMNKGKFNFSPGEYGNYYYIVDKKQCSIEYFNNAKEFKEKYPEEFLKE